MSTLHRVFGLDEAGAGPVDATISADPVAFLMVGTGRLSRYQATPLGLMRVGANRPGLAIGFQDLFLYPGARQRTAGRRPEAGQAGQSTSSKSSSVTAPTRTVR